MAQPISVSMVEASIGSPTMAVTVRYRCSMTTGGGLPVIQSVATQERERQLMEGAGADARARGTPWRRRTGHGDAVVVETLAELIGRLAGERADGGVIGVGGTVPDTPGGPEGEHSGLARTGAGDDAQRRSCRVDASALDLGQRRHGPLEGVVGRPRRAKLSRPAADSRGSTGVEAIGRVFRC